MAETKAREAARQEARLAQQAEDWRQRHDVERRRREEVGKVAERMAREAQEKAEEARRDHEAEVQRLQRLLNESREEQTEGVAER